MVRVMPPTYVKPSVWRGRPDVADAAAATRPRVRFVGVKTVAQHRGLMLHRRRALLVRQRTMPITALRAHLAELGLIAARGPGGVGSRTAARDAEQDNRPDPAHQVLHGRVDPLRSLAGRQDNPRKSWAARLLAGKPARGAAVALANKTARIARALLAHHQSYTAPVV